MRDIPVITKNLLIINVLCFLAASILEPRGIDFSAIFGLHYVQAENFHLWQFITYMFMHAGWMHLFFNMFALWMFGGLIERTFGQRRFLIYYLVCGLGAALCQELSQAVQIYSMLAPQGVTLGDMMTLSDADRHVLNAFTTVGASGAVYGILLAFGMTFPEERLFIFPLPVPIKAKWFVVGYAAIELWSAIGNAHGATDGVAHVAHLGGMLFGYLLIRMWRKTSYSFNGWDGYEIREDGFFTRMSQKLRDLFKGGKSGASRSSRGHKDSNTRTSANPDWDYNARKKEKEEEMDRILDKIKHSGYDSLTDEEKKKLFDAK